MDLKRRLKLTEKERAYLETFWGVRPAIALRHNRQRTALTKLTSANLSARGKKLMFDCFITEVTSRRGNIYPQDYSPNGSFRKVTFTACPSPEFEFDGRTRIQSGKAGVIVDRPNALLKLAVR